MKKRRKTTLPVRTILLKKTRIRLAAAFLATFAGLSAIFAFFETQMYYQRQKNYLYLAANQARLMEGNLDAIMARVYTLRSLVTTNDGNTDFFDDVAADIYEEAAADTGLFVKNLILAPDGIVSYVYPLEGNEALIGLDYMDESQAGNEEAMEAYEQNKLVLTEPFSLKQGGTGIAGRLPVYLEKDGEQTFWGMVSVTLDMDYLLEQFNLSYLEESGTDYCLWYTATNGEKITLASSANLPENPIGFQMSVSTINWTLDVAPSESWFPIPEIVGGGLLILLLSLLFLHILTTRARMRTMNAALQEIAIKDNLTGCYSRHYVNVVLLIPGTKQWLDSNACYSLAVIDVDRFKQINDTYGHEMGDRALIAIAHTLQSHCDELRGDCVVRYGGDEFIVLMNNIYRERFEERLQAIVEDVREIRVPEAPDMRLTVSIGAVMGDKKSTYYELFSRADNQVYLAKENGKDRYELL